MDMSIKFPHGEDILLEQGKPIVILGANGSGKTRFSVKVEELNDKRFRMGNVGNDELLVHRLSAQKSLNIPDKIALTDHESAKKNLYFGGSSASASKSSYRYNSQPATFLLHDFDNALALLFAEENKELQLAHEADKQAVAKGVERPQIITTIQERATKIWNDLLPQRRIDLSGSGVNVVYKESKYHGKEMSDGERVMLYMICQALILPKNSVIIIDEPELHIHKAIVKKLWDRLEQERQDCVFMYITHDLDFAASRNTDKILWVKNYDGTNWDYEFLNTLEFDDLPEELLFEMIGTRKKLLFVEGERNSYDYMLYSEFFRDKEYHIIPCGGCNEVLRIFKAKKAYEKLNDIEAYCLIDRDFRTDTEIASLETDCVAFLKVAEVENLFVVPALLDIMGEQLGCQPDASQQAKKFITDLFACTKAGQIGEAFIKEINHQLTILNFGGETKTPAEVQSGIANKFSAEAIQNYFDEKQHVFDAVTELEDILKVYNFKELSIKIGSKFGLQGNTYPQRVLNLLKTNTNGVRERIIDALKPYIPDLP